MIKCIEERYLQGNWRMINMCRVLGVQTYSCMTSCQTFLKEWGRSLQVREPCDMRDMINNLFSLRLIELEDRLSYEVWVYITNCTETMWV